MMQVTVGDLISGGLLKWSEYASNRTAQLMARNISREGLIAGQEYFGWCNRPI